MIKILGYEIKRLLWNKFFIILFIITIFYGSFILFGSIILGVANTAPFSPWSFGYYLSQVMPLILISVLFFISFLYSAKEKRVQTLTAATPVNNIKYKFVRIAAMCLGYLMLCSGVFLTGLMFYMKLFKFKEIGTLFLPAVLTLFPFMIFMMGLGLTIGRIHINAIFALMVMFLFSNMISLPYEIEFIGSSFFSKYPLELGILDPKLDTPYTFIAGRMLYTVIGLALVLYHCFRKTKA